MANNRSQLLEEFLRQHRLVRFSRRFESSTVRGYVLDVGPKFFLLALVSDRIWLDGFECFRISDIRKLAEDPYAAFVASALKRRGERVPKNPRIKTGSTQELLKSAGRGFKLVTIHRERIDPDICWIGRILEVDSRRVSMLEINPDASWDPEPNRFPLNEITRVNFGGDYENALQLVGGGGQVAG